MKKLLVILLGFCFALPAFAAGVRAVNNEAWLDHLAQMQVIRQQMLSLITRENPTADDKAVLESLKLEFDAKKAEWETYLLEVSQGQESATADEAIVEPAKKADLCSDKGDCPSKKGHKKHGKKHWGRHVCGEACKDGCTKPKAKDCCGSAMCKEVGKCIREAKKAHKSCKGCAKEAKCGKAAPEACGKENVKPCAKGKDCCQVTGKECTDANCGSSKKECNPGKKRWGRHVCGEACKNGCIKPKMEKCCGSAMCKEVGKCIRDAKKAAKACPKGDKCHKVTGIKCETPCKDCVESSKK
ncbi:MAG: hypothetical protein A2W80_02445 [Candidatus Riflebacteria bacterium GWC2_50_8]|nr:MAG: hypothetical protein A2W80_02445 [Candidatus Riflebacteria bacterium GWC2_50_8]